MFAADKIQVVDHVNAPFAYNQCSKLPRCQTYKPYTQQKGEAQERQAVFPDYAFHQYRQQKDKECSKAKDNEELETRLVENTQPQSRQQTVESIITHFNLQTIQSDEISQGI